MTHADKSFQPLGQDGCTLYASLWRLLLRDELPKADIQVGTRVTFNHLLQQASTAV